jgi:GNAT superfamily N-acetyltransferase
MTAAIRGNCQRPMNIRPAQPADIKTLFDIRTSVVENHQSLEEIAELGITPQSVATMLATDCAAWLAEIDGRPVGFAIANATERTLFGLFVLPAFEGRGAGRALIQAAENWLWSKGAEDIWLVTGNDPSLRAYGFYLHLGWTAVGVESEGELAGQMKFIKRRQTPLPDLP